ncbi:MAG: glycosyltransferase family 2 protein [Candidatus Dormibacteraceae bacterium]
MTGGDAEPAASVVILNYNGLHFLDACLTLLLAQELEPRRPGAGFEVLLVDNASVDGSSEHVRCRYPRVRVIDAGANLGFAAGNNLGIREAAGRYVVLLNNDTRVRPGWLAALVAAADSDEAVGAVAAKLVFLDPPNTIQNAGSILLSDGSGADRGFREPDRGQYDRREEVFGACGASVLLRRRMLEDVGDFDETFFMYYEDTDLNWRMRLRGWRVLYEPAAVVDHVHAGSSVEWSPFFTFHVDRNRLLMLAKNAPPRAVARSYAAFVRLAARNAVRGVVRPLRRRMRPLRPLFTPLMGPPNLELQRAFDQTLPAEARHGSGFGRAKIHAKVLASLLRHLPGMLAKRRRIRSRRRVADSEIERWTVPRELWRKT